MSTAIDKLTKPGLDYGGVPLAGTDENWGGPSRVKFFNSPAERSIDFAKNSAKLLQPSAAETDASIGPNGENESVTRLGEPDTILPKFFKPTFQQATTDQNGLQVQNTPATTKLGKFMQIVTSAAKGGLVGSSYDNAGQGFVAATTEPYREANMKLGTEREGIQNQVLRANTAPVQTPWGVMPMFRAQQLVGMKKDIAAINKDRFVTPRNGGVYDTSSGTYAPGTEPPDKVQNQSPLQVYADTVKAKMGKGLQGDQLMNDPDVQSALRAYQATQKEGRPDNLDQQYLEAATRGDTATMANIEKAWKAKASNTHITVANPNNELAPDDFESLVQGLLRGTLDARTAFGRGGTQLRARAIAEASRRDPNFTMATFPLRQQSYQYFFGNGKGADQIQSFNTFLGHAKDLSDEVNRYRTSNLRLINKSLNWWNSNIKGSPEYTAYMAALQPVRDEFMTFLQNNHAMTDMDRKAGQIILSDEATPAQQQEAIKQLSKTAAIRLGENNNRYRRVFGEDIPDLLPEDNAQFLRAVGAYDQVFKDKVKGGRFGRSPESSQPAAPAPGAKNFGGVKGAVAF